LINGGFTSDNWIVSRITFCSIERQEITAFAPAEGPSRTLHGYRFTETVLGEALVEVGHPIVL
jgi:hypothetical protein